MLRRRGHRIATWIGVGLCCAVSAVWLLSYPHFYYSFGNTRTFGVHGGRVTVGWGEALPDKQIYFLLPVDGPWPQLHGTSTWSQIDCPLWLILLAIAIPTAWLWRRDRRHPPGHCRNCGYDLTGNVTGVCSECGREVSAP